MSPFIRYYFKCLYLQAQTSLGLSNRSHEFFYSHLDNEASGQWERKYWLTDMGLGVGYDISLSKKVKLEPMVRHMRNIFRDKKIFSLESVNSDTYLTLGLVYLF